MRLGTSHPVQPSKACILCDGSPLSQANIWSRIADGAVQHAVLQLMSGTWTADGARPRMTIGRATLLVQIDDQRG
jgi:hypothetical protein